MDAETLYEMAAAAARNAERNCTPSSSTMFYEGYGGYPAYVGEYNRLLPMIWELFGDDAKAMFAPLDLGKQINPADTIGAMWKTYAELAASRLSALAAYLKTKQGVKKREGDDIAALIEANLRAALYAEPQNERALQDVIETIFRVRSLDYRREKISIPYSTKRYVPDFTFDSLGLAVEVKLCKQPGREREMIDEINADIIGYRAMYDTILFVVYDVGNIRDVTAFRSSIELQPGVRMLVVKQ